MRINETIYLDHQATTPVDPRILEKMRPYFTESFGNPHSSDHFLGWQSSRAIEDSAASLARLIGAETDEIIFTSGATEANNFALLGLGRRAAAGKRRRILLSTVEHKCILAVGRVLKEQYGYSVEQIPVDREGFVSAQALEETLDDDVLAVSVMAVNNEIGTIQDIKSISALARSRGAIFHCDAVQAPIAMNMDSFTSYADILSLSSHKMYGPKGVGAIYISRELQDSIEPLIYGGGQQNGLRSGTVPVPLCVGMAAAAELLMDEETENLRTILRQRCQVFIENLNSLPHSIAINGPQSSSRHPGNANIRFQGFSAHEILSALQPNIAASTGSACTSGMPETSHVLRAIGLDQEASESSIRFSLGFGTTEDDIEQAVHLIGAVLNKLKGTGLHSP